MYARVQDVMALLGRIAVGVVFLAHGIQKWNTGLDGVTKMTSGMGIPLPAAAALFLIVLETIGAVAFVVGFALPVLGVLYAIDMGGAILWVHGSNGLTGQGGFELVLVLGMAALVLGFNGGRLSLDHVLFWRRLARRREPAIA